VPDSEKYTKILIIRQSSIGDIILTTPLVRSVRTHYPKAQIDFVIKKEFADLLRHNPHISNVLTYDKKTGFAGLKELKKQLQAEKYDRIIDLHKNLRSYFLRTGLDAKITSYSKEYWNRFFLLKFRVNRYPEVITPVYQRYFDTLKPEGISYDGKGTEIFLPLSEIEFVSEKLKAKGYDFTKPLIVLCPGASSPTKRWLPERFAEVGKYYIQKYGAWIIFVGGREDIELCERIQQDITVEMNFKTTAKTLNFAGKLNLLESGALLKMAHLAITNDTGMMHMAQAQKTPVTAIFGCTTYELGFFPLPEKSAVVEKDLSCRPCTANGRDQCPKGHFDCMNQISSREVIEAGLSVLKK